MYEFINAFFHGWRRKIGGSALLIACALFVAWMRSIAIADVLWFDVDGQRHMMMSHSGRLLWKSYPAYGPDYFVANVERASPLFNDLLNDLRPAVHAWIVSVPLLVLMLTLASAYLILGASCRMRMVKFE